MKKNVLIAMLLGTTLTQAQVAPQQGVWRGIFTTASAQEIPFNFELKNTTAYLINATERFELKNVVQKRDSLFLPIDVYDAVLAAKVESPTRLSGAFRRNGVTDAGIPFQAEFGPKYRFFETAPTASVSLKGKWDVIIGDDKGGGRSVVGVFEQAGSKVTGTFLTTTGDYRYFEGSVAGNEFFLSAFSGSNPTLIKGRVSGNELTGEFIGFRGTQMLVGTRNDQAALPNAYTLTKLKDGAKTLNFSFPDAFTGQAVSLKDSKFQGKAVIVTILGSWCPNCVDEAQFLAPWYKANRNRGVEIVGLAFERKNDPTFAKARLEALKNRFGIEYDLLFAGIADKKFASSVLPELSEVLSFPTTIYIDHTGKITKIHTGYTGPATGAYYEAFVKEFNEDVNRLLATTLPKVIDSGGRK